MTEEARQPFEEEAVRINSKAKGIEKHVAKKTEVGPSRLESLFSSFDFD